MNAMRETMAGSGSRGRLVGALLALLAGGVIASCDSWRMALLAATTSGALAATRVRFAARVGVGVMVVVAALALVGVARGGDQPAPLERDDRHGAQASERR